MEFLKNFGKKNGISEKNWGQNGVFEKFLGRKNKFLVSLARGNV